MMAARHSSPPASPVPNGWVLVGAGIAAWLLLASVVFVLGIIGGVK